MPDSKQMAAVAAQTDRANAPLISFTLDEDLRTLSDLLGELSGVLEANRTAADDLCAVADGLDSQDGEIDDGDTDTLDGTEQEDDEQVPNEAVLVENEALRKMISAQRAKNSAGVQLLRTYMLGLEQCLGQLRQYVHERTLETLEIHREYIDKIDNEQMKFVQMVQDGEEVHSKVLALARSLGRIHSLASGFDEKNIEKSIDFIDGFRSVLETVLDSKSQEAS